MVERDQVSPDRMSRGGWTRADESGRDRMPWELPRIIFSADPKLTLCAPTWKIRSFRRTSERLQTLNRRDHSAERSNRDN